MSLRIYTAYIPTFFSGGGAPLCQPLHVGKVVQVFRDQMAKREMTSSKLFQEGKESTGCTKQQLAEFKKRFTSNMDGHLAAVRHFDVLSLRNMQ